MILCRIPFDSMDPQPTMKKTPANTAEGMVWRTISKGPVMVPIMARPIRKCEMRCSITAVRVVIGWRSSVPSVPSGSEGLDVGMMWRVVLVMVREVVWTGA